MNPKWIPEIGDWVTFCDRNTGEVKLGIVDQRFKNPQTNAISLSIEGQRVPLVDCHPPGFDLAYVEYQRLLDRCAAIGELADALQGT
jgi:hypothetical protein